MANRPTSNSIARKNAKLAGQITFESPLPCPNGHQSTIRYVKGNICVECQKAHVYRWADNNREAYLQKQRAYYHRHKNTNTFGVE